MRACFRAIKIAGSIFRLPFLEGIGLESREAYWRARMFDSLGAMLEPVQNTAVSLGTILEPLQKTADSLGLSSVNLAIILVCSVIILCGPWVRIFRRVGHSPVLGFLMFIPIVNIIVFLLFAYYEWPIEKDRKLHDESTLMRM